MKKTSLAIGIFVLFVIPTSVVLFVIPTSVSACVSFPTLKFDDKTVMFETEIDSALEQLEEENSYIVSVCNVKKCMLNDYPTECPPCPYYKNETRYNITEEQIETTREQAVKEKLQQVRLGYEVSTCDEEWCVGHDYPPECPPCPERTETIQYDLSDIKIGKIAEFIVNGYTVEEMTEEEYQAFLIRAKQINDNPKNCGLYRAVARGGRWTGYILDRKENQYCPIIKCPPVEFNVIWNDLTLEKEQKIFPYLLYLIPAILIILLVVLFLKFRKR